MSKLNVMVGLAIGAIWVGAVCQLIAAYLAFTEYGVVGALIVIGSFLPSWITALAAGHLSAESVKLTDALLASGPVVEKLLDSGRTLDRKVDLLHKQMDMLWRTKGGGSTLQ